MQMYMATAQSVWKISAGDFAPQFVILQRFAPRVCRSRHNFADSHQVVKVPMLFRTFTLLRKEHDAYPFETDCVR